MFELESSIRLVTLQFNFSNQNIIPSSLGYAPDEKSEEREVRSGRASGVVIQESVGDVSLAEFIDELIAVGYELVSAFCQQRRSPTGNVYYMARFIFGRKDSARVSFEEFKQRRDIILEQLRDFCTIAVWQMVIYQNPLYEKGKEIAGQHAISINLAMRKQIFFGDKPYTLWWKDNNRERKDSKPRKLKPQYQLRIEGNVTKLLEA